jgi:hypothetical protein
MRIAKRTDWKTKDLPLKRSTLSLDRVFSHQEMERIRHGLVPQQMEDKWFIYYQSNSLYFHRSWTGNCIYVVRFSDEGERGHMVEADVNRDPAQHEATGDGQDADMISYLIDLLLLHRSSDYPRSDTSRAKGAIEQWGWVGRAMLGQHPEA